MTEDELNATGEWLWVPDDTEVFVPAKLLASRGKKHRVEYEDGRKGTVKKADCLPFNRSSLTRIVGDLTLLDDMSTPLILHNLRVRFENRSDPKIYTNIGNILVAINPYVWLPDSRSSSHSPAEIRRYSARKLGQEMPPHVFNIGHEAYYSMSAFEQLQPVKRFAQSTFSHRLELSGVGHTDPVHKVLSATVCRSRRRCSLGRAQGKKAHSS